MYSIICKFCGKSFKWNNCQKRYCSDECRKNGINDSIVKKEQHENKCVICGKEFKSVKKGKMYCSEVCNQRASKKRNERNYNQICVVCKNKFVSKLKNTRFCSKKCEAKNKKEIRTGLFEKCKECGNQFEKKHIRHSFCSVKCKAKFVNKNKEKFIVQCSNCKKEIKRGKYEIKTHKNFFCSRKCESKFRENNANDVRICEFCRKKFSCKKSDKLRFCSMVCQSNWQKKTGSGKNHPCYKHEITDEMRIKKCKYCGKDIVGTPKEFETKKYCSRQCMIMGQTKSKTFPHKETIRAIEELKYSYEIEKQVNKYLIDCCVLNKYFIEVMGQFWHCDNRKYPEPINKIQIDAIPKDKRKNQFISSKFGKILYIWEKDINEDYEMCKKLIQEFVEKNGKLNNYHSMNYELVNGKLKLRSEILIPFFER